MKLSKLPVLVIFLLSSNAYPAAVKVSIDSQKIDNPKKLKKLAEVNALVETLGNLSWELHCKKTDDFSPNAINVAYNEYFQHWKRVKKTVEQCVMKEGIPPDAIGHPKNGLLWHCNAFNDVEFAQLLIRHGADLNNFDRHCAGRMSFNMATMLLTHGYTTERILHNNIECVHQDSADLILLYYCVGANPNDVDLYGRTALVALTEEIVDGYIFFSKKREGRFPYDAQSVTHCLKVAENLVKIGASLDIPIAHDHITYRNFVTCCEGDTVNSLLEKGLKKHTVQKLIDRHTVEGGNNSGAHGVERIMAFQHMIEQTKKEVDDAQKQHAEKMGILLYDHIKSRDCCRLVVHYAQQHVLPASALADIEKFPACARVITQRFLPSQKKESSDGSCAIS